MRRLTFELSRPRRTASLAGRRMIDRGGGWPNWAAVAGRRLERGVRPHPSRAELGLLSDPLTRFLPLSACWSVVLLASPIAVPAVQAVADIDVARQIARRITRAQLGAPLGGDCSSLCVTVRTQGQPDIENLRPTQEAVPADCPKAKLRTATRTGVDSVRAGEALERGQPALVGADCEEREVLQACVS
jgi:hypothetical protein